MATEPEELRRSLEYQELFNRIIDRIHESDHFSEIMPLVQSDLLELINAERATIYQRARGNKEIVSSFKVGDGLKEIRVPLSTTSISGFVALTQRSVRILDVYDAEELKRIHPNLRFDDSFDKKSGFRSRSMVVVPIKFKETMLGVFQVLNRRDGGHFTDSDVKNVMRVAHVLGQKFRYELQSTQGPYDWLVLQRQITKEQLDSLEERARKENAHISHLLMREVNISAAEIGASLERYYQVSFQPYDPEIDVPRDLMHGLNEAYLRKQLWVPVGGDREEVTIAIDDPNDTQRIMEIQRVLRANNYVFRVALPDDILRFLGQEVAGPSSNVDISELVGKLQEESLDDGVEEVSTEVDENEATVIQLVNRLIVDSYKARASDIHIEPSKGKVNAVVRIRVDGACRPSLHIPASHVRAVVSRIKIMARLDISERRKPQDGKLMIKYRGQPVELRVATVPTVNGESVVMRILAASEPLPLEKLNLSERNLTTLKEAVAHPHGIFLVVGPTGSGKTTTLHAVLGHINTPDRKIWTAEDPVEITQPGLQQVQVMPKIGFTFEAALRSFLRADPDVIMIGEMRDRETAEAGVEASLTGHLVFSTLHTNSAPETVVRLLDLGIDPVSFADALLGVLAQRLVRTLCAKCREPYQGSEKEFKQLQRYYGEEQFDELGITRDSFTLHRAKGCPECDNTGYRGRTGIHELLIATDAMTDRIYHKAAASEIKQQAIADGMRTLMQDGIAKLLKGQIDLDQLRRVVAE